MICGIMKWFFLDWNFMNLIYIYIYKWKNCERNNIFNLFFFFQQTIVRIFFCFKLLNFYCFFNSICMVSFWRLKIIRANYWKLLIREFWYFIGFEKYIYKRKKFRNYWKFIPCLFIFVWFRFWFFQLNGVRRENIGILFPNFKLILFSIFFF